MLETVLKRICPNAAVQHHDRSDAAFALLAREDPDARAFDVLVFDEDFKGVCDNGSVVIARILGELKFKRRPLIISCTGNADNPEEVARLRGVGADLVWGKPMPEEEEAREQVHQAIESLKWEY